MIANKKLSKDAIDSIADFLAMLKDSKVRAEVNIEEELGGFLWGVHIKYFDPDGVLAAEEKFLTMKGSTRRVAAFVAIYDPKGAAFESEWSPVFLPEPSKSISEFVIAILEDMDGAVGHGFAPSVMTLYVLDLDESCSCDEEGGSCACEGKDDPDDDDDSDDGDNDADPGAE